MTAGRQFTLLIATTTTTTTTTKQNKQQQNKTTTTTTRPSVTLFSSCCRLRLIHLPRGRLYQDGGYLRFQLRCSSIEVFGALRVTGVPQRRGRTQD